MRPGGSHNLANKLSGEIKATQIIAMPKPTGKPLHVSPPVCITLETSPARVKLVSVNALSDDGKWI